MTATRIYLTTQDLIDTLRAEAASALAYGRCLCPAQPHTDQRRNQALAVQLWGQLSRALTDLGAIADDDYRSLRTWVGTWVNVIHNADGQGSPLRTAAHRVACSIAGVRYVSVDGVIGS